MKLVSLLGFKMRFYCVMLPRFVALFAMLLPVIGKAELHLIGGCKDDRPLGDASSRVSNLVVFGKADQKSKFTVIKFQGHILKSVAGATRSERTPFTGMLFISVLDGPSGGRYLAKVLGNGMDWLNVRGEPNRTGLKLALTMAKDSMFISSGTAVLTASSCSYVDIRLNQLLSNWVNK